MEKEMIESASECGLRSIYILLGSMDKMKIKGESLSYEAPFGVGYGVLKFDTSPNEAHDLLNKISNIKEEAMNKIRSSEDEYVRLARETLEHYVKTGEFITLHPM